MEYHVEWKTGSNCGAYNTKAKSQEEVLNTLLSNLATCSHGIPDCRVSISPIEFKYVTSRK